MEPSEPAQPDAGQGSAPPPPQPPVGWAPPVEETPPPLGGGTGALFKNRAASSLTIGDAISTGFTVVAKPTFIIPVLILGVIVNVLVSLVFAPYLPAREAGQVPALSSQDAQRLIGALIGSVILSIVAGLIINIYGQVWAVAATSGPLPTIGDTFGLAGRRWISIIGAGLVVAVITIGLLVGLSILVGVVFAALGALGWLVLIAALVAYIWAAARLSMAGWLAAEGHPVMAAVNGSWAITRNNVLRIIGWSLAYGFVFGLIGVVLGIILGLVPYIGAGIAQSIGVALGYGGGVTLFRRTQAAAAASATPSAMATPAAT